MRIQTLLLLFFTLTLTGSAFSQMLDAPAYTAPYQTGLLKDLNRKMRPDSVERLARFPGCEVLGLDKKLTVACATEKMLRYIFRYMEYPEEAKTKKVEGQVVVTFTITEEGEMENIRLTKDIGSGCGEEALRVVNQMKAERIIWTPALLNSKPQKIAFNLPVNFKL